MDENDGEKLAMKNNKPIIVFEPGHSYVYPCMSDVVDEYKLSSATSLAYYIDKNKSWSYTDDNGHQHCDIWFDYLEE